MGTNSTVKSCTSRSRRVDPDLRVEHLRHRRAAAETAAGGRDARDAETFLEAVDVALGAIPEATVTFERFASELFVAMTP